MGGEGVGMKVSYYSAGCGTYTHISFSLSLSLFLLFSIRESSSLPYLRTSEERAAFVQRGNILVVTHD